MAELPTSPEAPKPGKMAGWIKAVLCTAGGLLSGGVVTYLTPLVDRLVKPAKPLANFSQEHKGLTVTFINRSTGGTEGWWDFGDGSSLEPVSPKENSISHQYQKPGVYTVKLNLRNYVGEESERTGSVTVEEAKPTDPAIVSFEAVPVSTEVYAPATFRVTTKVANADLCVFHFGDRQAMQVVTDTANAPEKLVTFNRPGIHTLRVLAVQGKKTVEKSQQVEVKQAPAGTVLATFTATETATRVTTKKAPPAWVSVQFPDNNKGPVYRFERKIDAPPGWTIAGDPTWTDLNNTGKGLALKVAPDRKSALLTGEIHRATGLLGKKMAAPLLSVKVEVTLQQRSTDSHPLAFTMAVGPRGASVFNLTRDKTWENVQRTGWKVEVKEDGRAVWPGPQLPQDMPITLHKILCRISASVDGDRVQVNVVPDKRGQGPNAN
jgi:PKD repeat protein